MRNKVRRYSSDSKQIHVLKLIKDAADLSISTRGFYFLSAVIWLFYGLSTNSKPIIITPGLWGISLWLEPVDVGQLISKVLPGAPVISLEFESVR